MILFFLLIVTILLIIASVMIFKKRQAVLKRKAREKHDAHLSAIKPNLSFYLGITETSGSKPNCLCVENIGRGDACGIAIHDFYHPDEKEWRFTFKGIDRLAPGETAIVDFSFLVGEIAADNILDQLWMFDPDHDHDFAARIVIDFFDAEQNPYSQTFVIGEAKKKKQTRKHQLQIIRQAMSRGR